MMLQNYDQLFLLEVLVDELKLLKQTLLEHGPLEEEEDTPLRVRIKFSEFPCFEIEFPCVPQQKYDPYDEETRGATATIPFLSGKSCMFPLDPQVLLDDLQKYPLGVTIFKKSLNMTEPDVLGQSKIWMSDGMSEMVDKVSKWAIDEPLSETVRDIFPVKNSMHQDIGTISLLVRLTCFGKTIVTRFQIADNNKEFMFKNSKPTDYEFQCKKCMPGQPIIRTQPLPDLEELDEEEEEEGADGAPPADMLSQPSTDVQGMLEPVESIGPGAPYIPPQPGANADDPHLQRQQVEGPGFAASMEVRYPGYVDPNTVEPEITTGKKKKRRKKDKKGGGGGMDFFRPMNARSGYMKCCYDECVELSKPRRKRIKYCKFTSLNMYPGVVIGHKWCLHAKDHGPMRHGWAWDTTVPIGMKPDIMRGWFPGAVDVDCAKAIKQAIRDAEIRKNKRKMKMAPDRRKPTVLVRRIDGKYYVTMNPPREPGDLTDPEPITQTLEPMPGDDSDESDLDLEMTIPDPPYSIPPPVKHQAQQFCPEDFEVKLPTPPPEPKKKKKGGKKEKGGKNKKKPKEKPLVRPTRFEGEIYPWEKWIFYCGINPKKDKKGKGKGKKGKK